MTKQKIMPSNNIIIDGNQYNLSDPHLLPIDANLVGQQSAVLTVQVDASPWDVTFQSDLLTRGDEGDLMVVLTGPPNWSTTAHSVADSGAPPSGFTDVPDGPWPHSSSPQGDICTLVIPPQYQSRVKVIMVPLAGGNPRYIDPIIRNGHKTVGGTQR